MKSGSGVRTLEIFYGDPKIFYLTNTTVGVTGHNFLDGLESVSQTEVRGGDDWGLTG